MTSKLQLLNLESPTKLEPISFNSPKNSEKTMLFGESQE